MNQDFVKKFKKSEYADSIYYADLSRINNKIWMIMGYGKSEAARIASNNIEEDDISRDSTAIKAKDNILEARFDIGAINTELDEETRNELSKFHKVDYIAYCLSPEQTLEICNDQKKIIDVSLDKMSICSSIYVYPGCGAQMVFSQKELIDLNDTKRRITKFKEIVSQVKDIKLLFIPYMETLEEKANLYKEYN